MCVKIFPQWLQLRKELEYKRSMSLLGITREGCTFTPVNMPVVETLKSKYASISGVGGL